MNKTLTTKRQNKKGISLNESDRTQEHLAQKVLKESEVKYKSLFENAQVGMYRSKLDGSALLAVNMKLCEIFGYTEHEMLDNPATIRWADPDARAIMVDNLRKNGLLHDYEMNILTKSAEIRTLSISVNLFPEQEYLEGSAIDITERKRTEKALMSSEKRFRIAAESLTDVVYEWDLGDKVDWYGDIDGIMGYPANGFPRTLAGWVAKLHPEDTERVAAAIEGHLKRYEPYITEYRVMNIEGEWRWWSARGTALRDEQDVPYWWIGSITDITGRKQVEEALRISKENLLFATEGANLGIWNWNIMTGELIWSDQCKILFGIPLSEK
jgi:PAS domain S-box-containing protein